ncbi:alanine racemase [bacterium]|nr:alanine racemase [bacterium]
MTKARQTQVSTFRDAWVEVNLDYLTQNIKAFKEYLPEDKKLLAVVKADAYGHGVSMMLPTILSCKIDMLGVASIDEALDLRTAGAACDILVLGAPPVWAFESAIENDISISIFNDDHLEAAKQIYKRKSKPVKAHIKIDTGMNRIGVRAEDATDFIKRVQKLEYINLQGIFSHLANSDNEKLTKDQLDKWENIISNINTAGLLTHIFSSIGALSYKCSCNMIRLGGMIYGLNSPFPNNKKSPFEVKPILGLKARISNIHKVKKGEGVSYSYNFVADKDMTVATIPIGYADGIDRRLSGKISGYINDKKVNQIGNITMDQMMFDVTDIDTEVGEIITLLDERISIDEWAEKAETINYELTCRLKVRLPRIYTR